MAQQSKKQKEQTIKLRKIIIKLMREKASNKESIGMASYDILDGLCASLEKYPSQWFAAGMQLMQVGLINHNMWEVLQGNAVDLKL